MLLPDEILRRIEKLKRNRKTVVFTNGCFDVLHPGHLHILKQARSLGDFLIVGLNSDESVRRLKGADRPVFSEDARKEMLLAIRYVDEVVVFAEDTPEELILEIKPDILVKGSEYSASEIVGAETVESYGGRVVRIPMMPDYSTTNLLNRLKGIEE